MDVRITCKTNYAKDQGIDVDVVWLVNDGSEPDVDGDKVMGRIQQLVPECTLMYLNVPACTLMYQSVRAGKVDRNPKNTKLLNLFVFKNDPPSCILCNAPCEILLRNGARLGSILLS